MKLITIPPPVKATREMEQRVDCTKLRAQLTFGWGAAKEGMCPWGMLTDPDDQRTFMKGFADQDRLLSGLYWVEGARGCSGVYVLEEGRTLIDAGNMYGLFDELCELGESFLPERILLTHPHLDHVGGVEEIYQVASPDLYIHPAAREFLNLHREPFPAFFDALQSDGKLKLISDGDVIDGKPPLRAIHAPGHTGGDLCFFDEISGSLFSGDAVLPQKQNLPHDLCLCDDACGGNVEDRLRTLRRLLCLSVRHLFPGHGKPVLNRGGDQVKLALYSTYESLNCEHPERAWAAIGRDLLEAGMVDEARQCALKASQISGNAKEVMELRGLIARAAEE